MKQSLLAVEICGVLGRLHSIQGLAQSNNNAKLNYSAKHGKQSCWKQGAKWRKRWRWTKAEMDNKEQKGEQISAVPHSTSNANRMVS